MKPSDEAKRAALASFIEHAGWSVGPDGTNFKPNEDAVWFAWDAILSAAYAIDISQLTKESQ